MYSFREKGEVDLTIWYTVHSFSPKLFIISVKWKVRFQCNSEITWPVIDSAVAWFPYVCLRFFSSSCSLRKTMPRKFQGSGKSSFGGSKKNRYFLKIPKWQHKLFREYKRGNLISYFLNSAAKIRLYGQKISKNFRINRFFQSKAFFHLSSFLHTSCLSAFDIVI